MSYEDQYENGLRQTPQEIIDGFREDPDLTPVEKETNLGFAKCDDYARVYTEEAGIGRRLLKHPEFATVELRINTDDALGVRLSPDEFSEGVVTGVKGFIPIGALKVSARSRSTSEHASVVSKEVSSMWEKSTNTSDDEEGTNQNGQTRAEVSPVTGKKIYQAMGELGLASSDEIANHELVNRSQRQVQRALDIALEEGLVDSVNDGRRVRYYIDEEFVPEGERDRYGL